MLQASIFDWYADNENEPACAFALQCTRSCSPGRVVCCQSGGFIASGEIAPERAPQVFVPRGLTPFGAEGFGEVQTPLQVARGSEADEVKLRPGDPVFFRPPKSGEIAEVNQATSLKQTNYLSDSTNLLLHFIRGSTSTSSLVACLTSSCEQQHTEAWGMRFTNRSNGKLVLI